MYSKNSHLNFQLKVWLVTLIILIILIILVGGLTRLTDSGLSITTWELFVGFIPQLTNDKWIDYFNLSTSLTSEVRYLIRARSLLSNLSSFVRILSNFFLFFGDI